MDRKALLLGLTKLGLSEKESEVYLAALELGPSRVQDIARRSGVKRTSVYHVVDALVSRGLLRRELHGLKELLVARSPDALEQLLEQQREQFLLTLPYLESLHTLSVSESVIRHLEGITQVEEAYWEMLEKVRPHEDYLVMSNMERWEPLISKSFADNFLRRRGKLPIKVRMILGEGPVARERQRGRREGNEQTRILPKHSLLTTNLVIIPRRVFIHQFEPPYVGMVIENQHIIRMHREMYEIMWASLPSS